MREKQSFSGYKLRRRFIACRCDDEEGSKGEKTRAFWKTAWGSSISIVILATLIIPSSVSVSHTLTSYPTIALDSVSSSTNWTFTVAVISGGASSLSLDSSYLAAWTADGALKIFPKVLGTFNATGNLYYRGARYFDHDGDSFLSVGDSFIFDKTTYASGMAMGLLLADSGWVYMAFYSIGEVVGKHPENYESLPPPPQPLNPMPIILIMVGIACLGIVFVLAKGIVKKRSH